jgi:hypothetical protein
MRDDNCDSEQTDTNEDIEEIRQQDEARLPAGYHHGQSDFTIGTHSGGAAGVKRPLNPEDRFDE